MKLHPLCEALPEMAEDEFRNLVSDIKKNGLKEPIILYDHKILDGRHRYQACQIAGVQPEFKTFTGTNPAALVTSLNLVRRHLTGAQRAMAAAALNDYAVNGKTMPLTKAAEALHVSMKHANRAKRIRRQAIAPIQQAVQKGTLSLNAAAQLAKLPRKQQQQILNQGVAAAKEQAAELARPVAKKEITAEAMAEQKTRLLKALDDWWETTKPTLTYVTLTPEMIFQEVRQMIASV